MQQESIDWNFGADETSTTSRTMEETLKTDLAKDIATGIVAGVVATWLTDRIQNVLLQATPASELAREPATRDGSSAKSAARKLLEQTEAAPTEPALEAAKVCIHYGLGASWGPIYWVLRRRTRLTPMGAGAASGGALSLIVDETLNPLLGITPPPNAYPESAHLRGLLTHIAWGLACGATAEMLRRR